jgi:hypothetical protein
VGSRTSGIRGNEIADLQAKIASTSTAITLLPMSTYDYLKNQVKKMTNNKWLNIISNHQTKNNRKNY